MTSHKLLFFAAAAFLMTVPSAEAGLRVCNKSPETVSVVVGWNEGAGEIVTRGWYVAEPGACAVVVGGDLEKRYYYLRAEGSQGGEWDGEYIGCTASDRFSYRGGTSCPGFDRRSFALVDTGSALDWTTNLTPGTKDSESAGPVAALRVGWRPSLLAPDTSVMLLTNPYADGVSLQLKCFTRSGASKRLNVYVPGYGVSEVGFAQGWDGNFISGERCDAYDGARYVWTADAPR